MIDCFTSAMVTVLVLTDGNSSEDMDYGGNYVKQVESL